MLSSIIPDYTHLKVIQETSRSCDEEVDTLGELLGFGLAVGSSHDDGESLVVVLAQLLGDTKDLKGELASRRDDDGSSTCEAREESRSALSSSVEEGQP